MAVVQSKKGENVILNKTSFKNLFFDLWYRFGEPPWIIDEAQPDLVEAETKGEICGPTVLDAGCGTGNNAIYLASKGFKVTGVDVSAKAISIAKQKAREAKVEVIFITLDALKITTLAKKFDTIIDFGLFHNFAGDSRERYVRALSDICVSNGQLLMQCLGDKAGKYGVYPHKYGPQPLSQDAIRASFSKRWKIKWIHSGMCKSNEKFENYSSWLTNMTSIA